jgi:2,4-dienoyl-CoA reductase-like NADH-dependent reductase (Old Yellow Enzyme family)/thioredoxin reductase
VQSQAERAVPAEAAGGVAAAFPNLFKPIAIRSVTLRNRLVFQPHFTALGTIEGMPSDAHAAYHEERARGGVGLIVFESQTVHPTGKMSRRFVDAWDPAVIPHHRKVTEAVHAHGARIFSQLTHGGHTTLERPPHILWAPTQMPEPSSHFSTKAMDDDDIRAAIDGFSVSARIAMEAGFDGIEIKIAHDGLLRSFASPYFNRRTDGYGGSFQNRMRLSVEVMAAIKKATGDDVPLGVRLCVHEFTPFGYDLDYGLAMAEHLQATGLVDYFNADAGSFSSYWMEIPPAAVAAEDFRKLNVALKAASRIPVVAFGRVHPSYMGEAMIKAGEADMIGMARQLVADPETPNKLKAGRGDIVRWCISCNEACTYQVGFEKGIRCVHNPAAGREREASDRLLGKADRRRRVVVVGGGPAGLKVAEVAARRGHAVALLERERVLGGQIRLAVRQPLHDTIGEVTSYLEAMAGELGIEVRRGVTATPELLRQEGADVIVIATGSEPNLPGRAEDGGIRARALGRQVLPELPGLSQANVISCDEVLSGAVRPSGRVVVIDGNGHWEAAGTAEFLAEEGCSVELLTAGPVPGEELEGGARTLFLRRAAIKGIAIRANTVATAIDGRRVAVTPTFSAGDAYGWGQYVLLPGEDLWLEDVDWVVPVIGRRSREDLFLELKSSAGFDGVRIERVGDCVVPRLVQSTILEAFTLGRAL